MFPRMAFLVVVGLALTLGGGAYAADQFSEDLVFNGEQMAELPVGAVAESSEPSFIEEEGYLAAIEEQKYLAAAEAAAAAEWATYDEWAMYEWPAPEVTIAESESTAPEVTIAESESPEVTIAESESTDMDLSALAMDFQPTPSSDQTLDLRAFLEKREAEIQAA